MHGKSLRITCLYSKVLFHLRVIASAADCAIVHAPVHNLAYQLQALDLTCNVAQ